MSGGSMSQDIYFVGREYELKRYLEFLNGSPPPWMLVITGKPGIGKTALLEQLKHRTPHDGGIISLNFDKNDPPLRTDPLCFLEAVALRAKEFCDQDKARYFEDTLQKCRAALDD